MSRHTSASEKCRIASRRVCGSCPLIPTFLIHDQLAPDHQLGSNPASPIGATRRCVDLSDQARQPMPPQLARSRHPAHPVKVPSRRRSEDSTTQLGAVSLSGQVLDPRELPFGRIFSIVVKNSDAFLTTASSVSSSRIRPLARASSTLSMLDKPALSPRSTWSCATQRKTVASETPSSALTVLLGGRLGRVG
jgi:hypothetical protein